MGTGSIVKVWPLKAGYISSFTPNLANITSFDMVVTQPSWIL